MIYLDFWGPGANRTVSLFHGMVADGLRFLDRYPVTYTILSHKDGHTARRYQLPGMPTSFLIGPDGEILWRHVGFRKGDAETIRTRLPAALEKWQ
ncbi:MAG: TlpA disulfide reductase family protein [Pseudomonadales bacterium]|jgi:hypothetical protein|nr:TlpA disulfide reductase family protein [Pseudomonadales bacterium]MDP6471813.1 TlpA disulfide reductase family protein [Pseudomonadales bacterium]MDP6828773.1 TlpA disulfide reductase family protein [Pseudomonadales bacterium]MDP6970294.1 TlpA disulfide reductase family protein [Pseudomonadales bacterium]|tara:strand:- start:996 stop:1280 length:285 start_codon:yes stop_codon:yes gene_type:complete